MKKLLICIVLISLFGCESKVDGIFYISNGSEDQAEIPLRLIVDTDTIFDQTANYTNIMPDLQYVERIKLTKGKHKIIFEVPNTTLKQVKNVEFDKDKWIFISYQFEKPTDSLERIELDKNLKLVKKNTDSIYSLFYHGRKPSLIFHIMETQPIHM